MSERTGSVFMAFLVGGLVGAGLAVLLAPAAGEDTRRRIREGVENAGDWVKDTYSDARERVAEGATNIRNIVEERKEDLVAAYEAGKEAYHKGKERLLKEA